MATLADSLVSASARPLALRMRPDLTAQRQQYQGAGYWVIKEPVGLNYFRFHDEEYAILQLLDGKASMDQIKERFEADFAPHKITHAELQQFIGMLHRSGLVIGEGHGQGAQLKKRRDEKRRKEIYGMLSNVLAIRFKGIDPERILNWLYPRVSWFFSRTAFFLNLALALCALSLVLVNWNMFYARLPAFHEFFGPGNWLLLACVLGTTKVLHEFGHGLSCKHYGGECHEMGVMLLVLTPCLFCNVSDSWMLPSKWKRAAIGAAGMYVEVTLASLATIVWWFTDPGLLNHVCLRVMFICSVSTVLFNGNPLLRYDGYYITSDLLEIPNLRQKATNVLKRMSGKIFLGLDPPEDPFMPKRNHLMFALFAIASVIYRWVVVFSIMFFLNKVFEPYGLKIIGQMIAAMGIFGLLVMPLIQFGRFLLTPGRMQQVKKVRFYASVAVVGGILLMISMIPLPHRVRGALQLAPKDEVTVYVEEAGRLDQILVEPGQVVQAGDQLAVLSSIDLQMTLASLEGQKKLLEQQLVSVGIRRYTDPTAAGEMAPLRASRDTLDAQLNDKERDRESLILKAPISGTVLAVKQNKQPPAATGQLPMWSGTMMSKRNIGASVGGVDREQNVFCRIGDPSIVEAKMIINQSDIDEIALQQEVYLKLEAFPWKTFVGEVKEISLQELERTPESLSNAAGGSVPTQTDEAGVHRPLHTSYEVVVELKDVDVQLQSGMRGRGKIFVKWQPVGRTMWRYFASTFHFHM